MNIVKSNLSRVESLLQDPAPDATLDELKADLNALARLRNQSCLAFCKRLAIVYMMIVGRPQAVGNPRDGKPDAFFKWCRKNIRSAAGHEYTPHTLRTYVTAGFAQNPEKYIADRQAMERARDRKDTKHRALGRALERAADVIEPIQFKPRNTTNPNLAAEVRALIDAWDAASSLARRQFLDLISAVMRRAS